MRLPAVKINTVNCYELARPSIPLLATTPSKPYEAAAATFSRSLDICCRLPAKAGEAASVMVDADHSYGVLTPRLPLWAATSLR